VGESVTAKAKAPPQQHSHTTISNHGKTRTTVTRIGNETVKSVSTKAGNKRITTRTVTRHGKVISHSRSVSEVRRHAPVKRTTARKRGAIAPVAEGYWVTGCNDWLDTCVATAAANSLLLATGRRVEEWQVRALAGQRSIPDVLAAIGVPFREADSYQDGVILGVAGLHAVTVHDGAAVSWGAETALDGLVIEEAWEVSWR
jgi:hypothetical protein